MAVVGGATQRPSFQAFEVTGDEAEEGQTYPVNPTTALSLSAPLSVIVRERFDGVYDNHDYAYILSAGDVRNGILPALTILDITNPDSPELVVSYNGVGDRGFLGYPLFEPQATTALERAARAAESGTIRYPRRVAGWNHGSYRLHGPAAGSVWRDDCDDYAILMRTASAIFDPGAVNRENGLTGVRCLRRLASSRALGDCMSEAGSTM